ncbi:MAG: hypothetical protein U0354_00745 [Candidatus Sericytochromatia bacterium]
MIKINWDIASQKSQKLLLLDFFMLFIAILNLCIFSFDFTYLKFRNFYFHYIPILTEYDKVKGIRPHNTTVNYINQAQLFFNSIKSNQPNKTELALQMVKLSDQLIDEQPFSRANKEGEFELVKERMRKHLNVNSSRQAFNIFWTTTTNINVQENETFFDNKIKRIIETNYWRGIDYSGNYIDYFFYIDSFFVIIFLIEFLSMWSYAIRTRGEEEKVLYPIYHLYDLLGCIPLDSFRVLRLLRVIFIFRRLVKEGIISRDSLLYSSIANRIRKVKEVLDADTSNRISADILNDIKEDIKAGVNKDLAQQVLEKHNPRLQKVIVENIKKIEIRIVNENRKIIVDFLSHVIEDTIDDLPQYKTLMKIPYVKDKVAELLSEESINKFLDRSTISFATSLRAALNSELGDSLLNNIIADILDEILIILKEPEISDLMQDINANIVERLEAGVEEKRLKQKERFLFG